MMEYQVYRLHFLAGVHFGESALWDGADTLPADTLFSALCQEALLLGGQKQLDALVEMAKTGRLQLSDLLPYVGEELFLPKPLLPVQRKTAEESGQKKLFKKLRFVPVSAWQTYGRGDLDPAKALAALGKLGAFSVREVAATRSREKLDTGEALPYTVGVYRYGADSGLYLLAAFAGAAERTALETLLNSLKYSGLGGRRSAGLGRFSLEAAPPPEALLHRLRGEGAPCMSLSVCMAQPKELEAAMAGATYLLRRRAGFVASAAYAPTPQRKKDFYAFCAGSCFNNRFAGDVFDVAGGGAHPVYRYAKPMLMEV